MSAIQDREVINTDNPQMREITHRFSFHKPDAKGIEDMKTIRRCVRSLAYHIQLICPDGREKATALTNLAATMMNANSAIVQKYPLDPEDV